MWRTNEDGRVMESLVYFVDPKYPGSLSFLEGKESIRITIKMDHKA